MKVTVSRAQTVAGSRRGGSMRRRGAMVVLAAAATVRYVVSVAGTELVPAAGTRSAT
jgi:hypothetical protein